MASGTTIDMAGNDQIPARDRAASVPASKRADLAGAIDDLGAWAHMDDRLQRGRSRCVGRGGRGSVRGKLVAMLILGTPYNGRTPPDASGFWQDTTGGVVPVLAVAGGSGRNAAACGLARDLPSRYTIPILRAGRNSPPAVTARERLDPRGSADTGEIPGPTVIVRMKENDRSGPPPGAARGRLWVFVMTRKDPKQ